MSTDQVFVSSGYVGHITWDDIREMMGGGSRDERHPAT